MFSGFSVSRKASIQQLLQQPLLWQGSRAGSQRPTMTTGFPKLDAALHDGGWPQGGVSELLLTRYGVGELQLLRPLLTRLMSLGGYQVWVNPPFIPTAETLRRWGLSLDKLLLIRCDTTDSLIWAAYQALVSKACSAVLVWLPKHGVSKSHLRKLVLGARHGQCWGFVLRHAAAAREPSPCQLRISLTSNKLGDCKVSVLKQPGGWSGQELTLSLHSSRSFWTPLLAAEWPVYKPRLVATSGATLQPVTEHFGALDGWLQRQEDSAAKVFESALSSHLH